MDRYDEHSILRYRPDRRGMGLGCPCSAGGSSGRATAHHQPSCRPQRHLLPPADRLPVADVATRISTVWHGLPLLSIAVKSALTQFWCICGTFGPFALAP